jgi:predicted Fe-Mo cluster-binding NifX family protein
MKIAIPIANEQLCMHFGHCETFAVLTVDEKTKTITGRQNLVPPPHEPGVLPRWLGEQKVTVIIAGGMGQRAQQLFAEQNITVVVGAPSVAPDTLVADYLAGTLQSGANACDH